MESNPTEADTGSAKLQGLKGVSARNGKYSVNGILSVSCTDPRKRPAAAASRLAERRKSIVAPVESTARYKYTHLPFTRTYVSSTRQESFVVLSRLRRRRSNSGAYRWTQRQTVT
jgi:hypothetical protein